MVKLSKMLLAVAMIFCISNVSKSQHSIYEPLDLDRVEFSFDDFGKMWTFDAVPVERYQKEYNFKPDKAWLDDVQKSALQFGGGCSGAFVSEDGLIMTNHHCVRSRLDVVQQKGENIFKDGFYATTLGEERKFKGLYVDQLIEIKDVTGIILNAMKAQSSNNEKVAAKEKTIKKIVDEYSKKTGLTCKVVTLYNGGKYSLYMYKRYNDIRLVMVPDVQIAATGWDWDNFTYPRYELDFAFLRAYENGKPVKVKHFFKWSKKGAREGEAIFVVGRPGNTDRLLSMRQLQFFRDTRTPIVLNRFNELYKAYYKFFEQHPERRQELLSRLLSVANTRKSYAGGLMALNDDYLMKKKSDFEKKLRQKVEANPKLQKEYGNIWNEIDQVFNRLNKFEKEQLALLMSRYYMCDYQQTARNIVEYAEQMNLPEAERKPQYKANKLEQTKKNIFVATKDKELQDLVLIAHADFLDKVLGTKHKLSQIAYGGKTGEEALKFFVKKSKIADQKYVDKLVAKGAKAILNSQDPLIKYQIEAAKMKKSVKAERGELYNTLEVLNNRLGRLIFETYGTIIPPDATLTLRISDGRIKQYEYNGTIAPGKVTFYGLYDRYHSFGKKDYPWGLHERWQNPPAELDLSIPMGFASTNDIVGGNSGSTIINKNAEVIGLVHDGNIESLAGRYAFLGENNRAVATDSWGLMEALKYIYKTTRLVKELDKGKI